MNECVRRKAHGLEGETEEKSKKEYIRSECTVKKTITKALGVGNWEKTFESLIKESNVYLPASNITSVFSSRVLSRHFEAE